MTTTTRRSPKVAPDYNKADVRDAIDTLEDRPRVPEGTPASSADDGYEGAIKADASFIYIYRGGSWKRAALNAF